MSDESLTCGCLVWWEFDKCYIGASVIKCHSMLAITTSPTPCFELQLFKVFVILACSSSVHRLPEDLNPCTLGEAEPIYLIQPSQPRHLHNHAHQLQFVILSLVSHEFDEIDRN